MSDTARPWYQNGVVVFFVFLTVAWLWLSWKEGNKDRVNLLASGRIDTSLWGSRSMRLKCWHQYRGTLTKGRLTIKVSSPLVGEHPVTRYHSFDSWPPNEDCGVEFSIPLQTFDDQTPIDILFSVEAQNAKATVDTLRWQGNGSVDQ